MRQQNTFFSHAILIEGLYLQGMQSFSAYLKYIMNIIKNLSVLITVDITTNKGGGGSTA